MRLIDNHLQLCRRQCDERRRYLAELERLAQRLRADALRLKGEIDQADAAGDPAVAAPLVKRFGKIERSLATVESQVGDAAAMLAAAEQEVRHSERAFSLRTGMPSADPPQAARRRRRG